MRDYFKNTRFLLVLFHLALGFLLLNGMFSKLYAPLVVIVGFVSIIKSKNSHEQAAMWSAYLAGSDVLFRMSGGMLSHEMHKYGIALYFITALIVENKRKEVSPVFIFYILLLLIGIAFSDIPYPESVRKAIAFNLSGPISLGIAALYFYKREFTINKLLNVLYCLGLPIISMLSLLYFKTPDIREIVFGGSANFAASGGFGPNQVSTILGVGVFVFTVHFLFKKRYTAFLFFDIVLIVYIFYRNLLTFSRGGLLTAIIAIIFFAVLFIYNKKNRFSSIIKYTGIVFVFGIAVWIYTADATGGMLENRYANKNARGVKKKDLTTGRTKIFDSELEGLFENPIFGMGVGSGKFKRLENTGRVVASHNEMSRLLGEHGMIGVLILLLLIFIPIFNAWPQPAYAKAFLAAFFIFWFLTINHSAMRVSFPGFIYGLSLIRIKLYEKNPVHRK
ncbi:MAG: O-antigen ligase family protein [Flavobacteriaceae bacterium]|nr:O-antigen ligase family protein [Flavobacteriaceae bacterium]